jgi:large subunit ribosomal protein L25
MAVIALKGARREQLGKGGARQNRRAGNIPGVLYGQGKDPVAVSVGARDFQLALRTHKGGNPILNLALDGQEFTALIRAVQYDPVTHDILHLDFQHISLTETVEVQVSIHLVGLPVGVKDGGGILEHITRAVEVRCLPTAIPGSIDVNVEALSVGDSLHVRDLSVADVEILSDPDATIATVVPPTVIEEAAPVAEEAAAAATAEPEVIAKGKKEEEGEEAAAPAKEKEKK